MKITKYFKNEGTVFALVFCIVVFAALIAFIVCKKSDSIQVANDIVALVGIILAFISIFLSYRGLMMTKEVKEDIALQQYRIKQQEAMSKLVNNITTYTFLLDIRKDGISDTGECGFHTINLAGILNLVCDNREKYAQYNDIHIYCSEKFHFEPSEKFSGNPYLPASVIKSLANFLWNYRDIKNNKDIPNIILLRNITENSDFSKNEIVSIKGDLRWGKLIQDSEQLLKSIDNWYKINNLPLPYLVPIDDIYESK